MGHLNLLYSKCNALQISVSQKYKSTAIHLHYESWLSIPASASVCASEIAFNNTFTSTMCVQNRLAARGHLYITENMDKTSKAI